LIKDEEIEKQKKEIADVRTELDKVKVEA